MLIKVVLLRQIIDGDEMSTVDNIMIKNNSVENTIKFLLIVFFSVNYILTSLSNVIPYTLILLLEVAYVAYYFIIGDQRRKIEIIKYVGLIVLLTLLYYFFTLTATVSVDVSNYDIKRLFAKFNQFVNFFFPLLLFSEFITLKDKALQWVILTVIFVLFTYVVLNSYFIFRDNMDLSRNWSTFTESENENIATYYFVYAAAVVVPILFVFQQQHKNIILKLVAMLGIILLYMFLFVAQYTLAILIPTICILYAIMQKCKKRYRFLLFLFLCLLLIATPFILSFIAERVRSESMRVRLLAIVGFFNGSHDTDTLNSRTDLYRKCFEYFFKSPLIGNKTVPFDGHATFLTVLCDLGLLGTIPMYMLYFGSRKTVKSLLNNKIVYKDWFTSFVCMVIMGFTNPIHSAYALGYVVYFIGPAILMMKGSKGE